MPCNMDMTGAEIDAVNRRIDNLERQNQATLPRSVGPQQAAVPLEVWARQQVQIESMTCRIAMLEEALCGLCQQLPHRHPQLDAWFEWHKQQPGCEADNGDQS